MTTLYPLKFEPIYQYRIWGGRRLSDLLKKQLPADLIGEAWILSDRDDHPSKVTNGKLKGQTLTEILAHSPNELMGKLAGKFNKFPLLLKFLDCQKVLLVQVHPNDALKQYIPQGESGKTEAWVVLETGYDAIIYAGLKPGSDEKQLRAKLKEHKVADDLASFKPAVGDTVLIKAGTVHTLNDVVVFEVQENSDVTYRLYDWDRVDEKTGKPRDLQVEEAIACIDFSKTDIAPVTPAIELAERILCEKLIHDEHFILWRNTGSATFMVGREHAPRVLVCLDGKGVVECQNDFFALGKGEVMLLPAMAGPCPFVPDGHVTMLELGLPGE